jgi:cobalt-zinc-cadmium efflux system protein
MATHSHHNCEHHSAQGISDGKLMFSIVLTFGFVVLEAWFGWMSNSLALISDAGHNFTDGFALILSWYALRIARRPATPTRTYGYHRVGILTALFNAVTLVAVSGVIFREAIEAFLHPHPVSSGQMIVVASVAVVINTLIAVWLRQGAAHDVNIRGAFLHMVGDALFSAGVIVSGIIIYYTGWVYADPLMSMIIGVFIAWSSWGLLKETINILLEGTPQGMDLTVVAQQMSAISGVQNVHDLHIWTIADGMHALSCHLCLAPEAMSRAGSIVREVKSLLAEKHAIGHSTIETECIGECSDALTCHLAVRHSHEHAHEH